MITCIKVDGYKTLSNFELHLNPGLNILVGPNGSGKTNVVSFFEFLAHLIETDAAEAISKSGGAGAVFRKVQNTYQANISATVSGCLSTQNDGAVQVAIAILNHSQCAKNCCIVHDACFRDNNCHENSWLKYGCYPACDGCNRQVVGCMLTCAVRAYVGP